MQDTKFDVIVAGFSAGVDDRLAALTRLAQSLRLDEERVLALLEAGKGLTVKRGVDEALAEKICRALARAGLDARRQRVEAQELSLLPLEEESPGGFGVPEAAEPAGDPVHCPKCEVEQPGQEICVRCGLVFAKYQAMEAARAEARSQAEASEHEDEVPGSDFLGRVSGVFNRRFKRR